jgi:hypothetical protein
MSVQVQIHGIIRLGTARMTYPRKRLIEVVLQPEAINREEAREKSIRHGHPSTLHLWWARRPLGAPTGPSRSGFDLGAASVNYDLDELLARTGDPV